MFRQLLGCTVLTARECGAWHVRRKLKHAKALCELINRLKLEYGSKIKGVIVHPSMIPYEDKLWQRPHHFAHAAVRNNFLFIWTFPKWDLSPPYNKHTIVITPLLQESIRIVTLLFPSLKKFLVFYSTFTYPFPVLLKENLFKLKKAGWFVIYEYIDDLEVTRTLHTVWHYMWVLVRHNVLVRQCVQVPDLIVASARDLLAEVQKTCQQSKTLYLPNGVDVNHFASPHEEDCSSVSVPDWLKNTSSPVIGFYGLIASWIDLDLVRVLLKTFPQYLFVFIGPVKTSEFEKLVKEGYPNLKYLPPVPYRYLPCYSRYFSMGIIPFKKGAIARGTSPLKLYEYLAAGLPVVATADLRECAGIKGVWLAESYDEFVRSIQEALEFARRPESKLILLDAAKQFDWNTLMDRYFRKLFEIAEHTV